MCDCKEPVRHRCGGFGQFIRIAGGSDLYRCVKCELLFIKKCVLVLNSDGELEGGGLSEATQN